MAIPFSLSGKSLFILAVTIFVFLKFSSLMKNLISAFRMDYGNWTEESRGRYNKWDAISRCTTQVCFSFSILIFFPSVVSIQRDYEILIIHIYFCVTTI